VAQKPVLGKGLASLLPPAVSQSGSSGMPTTDASQKPSSEPAVGATAGQLVVGANAPSTGHRDVYMGITMANIEDIQINQRQPRRDFDEQAIHELSQSIKVSGIIQPLLVRKTSKDGFELIAGERRLRAAKLAGLKQVPIVIRKSTDREMLELALVENIQRQDLNCVDEALAYYQLIEDFTLTQEEVASRVGKDRATVANYLRILKLPEIILEDLKRGILTFGHGKALLSLEDREQRLQARAKILENRLSVRDAEELVEFLKQRKQGGAAPSGESGITNSMTQRFVNLSRELSRAWSAKIDIKGNEKKGRIVMYYSSREELDRLLEDLRTTA